MTKNEKLEGLKAFLTENGISFKENTNYCKDVLIDVFLPDFGIAVHVSDDADQDFFRRTKRRYRPFFVREEESVEFIIEKMQNCISDIMMKRQKTFEKNNRREDVKAEEPKRRKRVRIVCERVTI